MKAVILARLSSARRACSDATVHVTLQPAQFGVNTWMSSAAISLLNMAMALQASATACRGACARSNTSAFTR